MAAVHGDVPVGCVIVRGDTIIARAHNRREIDADPTAHAELLALRAAALALSTWRIADVTLYSTLEPCTMCAGALVNARVPRLVYGASDPKAGGVDSVFAIPTDPRLNHRVDCTGGVLREEAVALLRAFFGKLRAEGQK